MSSEESHLINLSAQLAETEITEMISINVICRLCANQSEKLIEIYGKDGVSNDLSGKINLYLPIKVSETDNMPLQCCWQCASTVLAWHDLVITTVEADRRLKSYQKDLVEITYGETDSLLVGNEDENLRNPKTTFEESENLDKCSKNNADTSLDHSINVNIKTNQQSLPLEECTSKTKDPYDVLTATEFSDNDDDLCVEKNATIIRLTNTTPNNISSNRLDRFVNFETNTCKICESTLPTIVMLQKHLKLIHKIKGIKVRRKKCDVVASFACSNCKKSYTRKHDLEKHVKFKHPHEAIQKKESKNADIVAKCKVMTLQGEALYQCDVCSKTFKKSYSLTRHRTIHSDNRPHCCYICGKSFRLVSSLIRHINEFHHDNRKNKCTICDKVFKNKTTRDEHLNIHNNVRPYVCDTCGKSFRQRASLYVHKQFHLKHFPYTCQVCDKRFQRKQNFRQHSLIHTGYKPFNCQQCGMLFRSKHDLNRHNRCHVPVFCDKCGSSFGQERYMKLHRKTCKQSFKDLSVMNIREKNEFEGVIIRKEEPFFDKNKNKGQLENV